jgi:Cd2+/Zn2+-exporting ATPase
VAVDKTGTLTKGRPRLTDVVVLDPSMDRSQVLTWAARAEASSEHPLACPILVAAAAEDLPSRRRVRPGCQRWPVSAWKPV